jgi:hypothetical protein
MADAGGALVVAVYAALVSSATAAVQLYQVYRKKRRLTYSFEHHPVRIHDEVGYVDDYLVKVILTNGSESEVTVLQCEFGIDKDVGGGFPRKNLAGYGKGEEVEFPFVIPAMSAKVLYSFASHWRRGDTLGAIPEGEFEHYKLYLTYETVGGKKKCKELKGAGPALLKHKIERVRER